MADPGPQLTQVLAFRRKLEETRKVLYHSFDDEKVFRLEIDKHLAAFADGKCERIDGDRTLPLVPDAIRAELEKHREAARCALEEVEKLRTEAEQARQEAELARAEARSATAQADAANRVVAATAAAQSLARRGGSGKSRPQGKD